MDRKVKYETWERMGDRILLLNTQMRTNELLDPIFVPAAVHAHVLHAIVHDFECTWVVVQFLVPTDRNWMQSPWMQWQEESWRFASRVPLGHRRLPPPAAIFFFFIKPIPLLSIGRPHDILLLLCGCHGRRENDGK